MNTRKVKTAIIVMLMAANIFFLWKLYTLNNEIRRLPPQMIEDAASALARGGLNVSKEIIVNIKPQNYIYEGEWEYSQEIFEKIASSISGSDISNTFLIPGGISYSAGDYRFSFRVFDESVKAENYLEDCFKINITGLSHLESSGQEEVYKSYEEDFDNDLERRAEILIMSGLKGYKRMDVAKSEKVIKDFLKKYQPEGIDFETVGFQKNENSEYIVIMQKLDGLAFDSHIVFAEIEDGKVSIFSGKWYFGSFVGRYTMPLLDAVNILFKYLEKDGMSMQEEETLNEVELYYSILWHDSTKFYLIPSWRLSFEGGKELMYNAVTGDKAQAAD